MKRITTFKLHKLIQSLKKEEKRSFKLAVNKYSLNNDTIYLQLFNYLDKVEVLDRDQFKKKFKHKKGVSNIQNYLYQQILKSLRSQQSYRNIDLQLMEGLAELEVLYKKNLLEETKETLLELQKLAEEHQKILLLPLIYEWWFKLESTRLRYDDVDEATFESYKEKYANSPFVLKEYIDTRLQLGFVLFATRGKHSRHFFDVVEEVQADLPTYKPNELQSIPTEVATLQLRAYLAATVRNRSEAERYHRYLYEYTKKLPPTVYEDYKRTHYSALGGLIINAETIEVALPLLEVFDNIDDSDRKYIPTSIYTSIASTKIHAYLSMGKFDTCKKYIEELLLDIKTYNSSFKSFINYQYALCYYAVKNRDKALEILATFLFDKEASDRLKSYGFLLKIIILYEQEEFEMLSYLIANTKRNFRRKETLFEFEKMFIAFINRLIDLPKAEQKTASLAFHSNLESFLASKDSYEKEFLVYFNYLGWVDCLIQKKPLKQLCYWNL